MHPGRNVDQTLPPFVAYRRMRRAGAFNAHAVTTHDPGDEVVTTCNRRKPQVRHFNPPSHL
jgi:hypothetical protein